MEKHYIGGLNKLFGIDGPDWEEWDNRDYEVTRTSNPFFGFNDRPRTEEEKQYQREVITEWWKNLPDEHREVMRENLSKAVKSHWEGMTPEERKKSRNWNKTPPRGKDNGMFGKPSRTKGKVWITDGKDSMMIDPSQDMPDGWKRGRIVTFTKEGRKNNLHQLKYNNPNSKTYKIIYSDGTEETVTQLSTWCRQKGLNYSSIKAIVRNKPKKRNRKYQFISDILLVTSKVSQ